MSKLIEKTRYVGLIGVVSLLLASAAAFFWGVVKTVGAVLLIVTSLGKDAHIVIGLIELVDAFLIATVLFVFAVSMYEMFIADLPGLPEWMLAHNLHELKAKLGGVIILVMVIQFLEHLIEWKSGNETMLFAIAVAVVSAALIALGHFDGKD